MSPDLLTIQQVGLATGVQPVTLRAWERRYGLLKPVRTSKGHRRYTQLDLQRIRAICHWLERGVAVSQVSELLNRPERIDTPSITSDDPWQQAQQDAHHYIKQMHASGLYQLLQSLTSDYGTTQTLMQFCWPMRRELGLGASLHGRRVWFDSQLQRYWAPHVAKLAPKKAQWGWLLVPTGGELMALELAMLLATPVWCLNQPVSAKELNVLSAERARCGVLWVADAVPTLRLQQQYWPSSPASFPVACWGPVISQLSLPEWVTPLDGPADRLFPALSRLQRQHEKDADHACSLVP